MTVSISTTYSSFSATFQPTQEHNWGSGYFINDTLLIVKGVSPNGCVSYFEVLDNKILQPYTFDCSDLQHLRSAPVRVVAKVGKKWMLRSYPSIARMCDMLWLYAIDLVSILIRVPFFQYSVKLWRSLLLSLNERCQQLRNIGLTGVSQLCIWKPIGDGSGHLRGQLDLFFSDGY